MISDKQILLEKRRRYYHENKDRLQLLQKYKNDRIECPLCKGITFRRLYLKNHLLKRHKVMLSELDLLLNQ